MQYKISSFSPTKDKNDVYVPGWVAQTADLYETLESFRSGLYSQVVRNIREQRSKSERDRLKTQSLKAFTFSCNFPAGGYRKTENIAEMLPFLCIDIDEKGLSEHLKLEKIQNEYYSIASLRDKITQMKGCIFAGLSVSGTGLFAIFHVEVTSFLDSFRDLQRYFKLKYKIDIDASCKDFVRLRFATHDPDAYLVTPEKAGVYEISKEYRDHQSQLEADKVKLKGKHLLPRDVEASEYALQRACHMISTAMVGERHNKILCASRLIGGYIASGIIDETHAREELITTVKNIDYDDMNDAVKCIDDGITHGKLSPLEFDVITPDDPQFEYYTTLSDARQEQFRQLKSEIRRLLRAGVDASRIPFEDLAMEYSYDIHRIKSIVKYVYEKYDYEFGYDKKPTISKVEIFLQGKMEIRRDVIHDTLEFKNKGDKSWEPMIVENVWRDIQKAGLKFKYDEISRLLRSDFVNKINIWEEHFKYISQSTDEFDYITDLASYIKLVDESHRDFFNVMFKKMLVRTVRCALDDSYANRFVFVLVSQAQHNGKSWFIRWLNPFGPHNSYAENPLEDGKDDRIRMSQTFIYNLEELSSISRHDINRLKGLISQIGTRDRLPYGREAQNIVRRCSFYGSTNSTTFLLDDINSRWLCFEISKIDWRYSTKFNQNQIWSQAYRLLCDGYDAELTTSEHSMRDRINEGFRVETSEDALVIRYFTPSSEEDPDSIFMSSTAIFEAILELTKDSRIHLNSKTLASALTRQKFKRVKHQGSFGFWVCPKSSLTPYQREKLFKSEQSDDVPF